AAITADRATLCAQLLKARGDYYATQVARYPYKRKYLNGWLLRNYRLALEVGRWLEWEV
ncbi:hypothetical protein LCGC14_1503680, partial [marine sediment metagenome]